MATLLSNGGDLYREIAPVLESTVERGQTTTRRWRGTYAALLAAAPNLGGISQRLEQEDEAWWVLSATYAGWPSDAESPTYPTADEQIVTLWSLPSQRFSKSIWEIPVVATELAKVRDLGGSYANVQGLARLRSDLLALARGEQTVVREASTTAEHNASVASRTIYITLDGVIELLAPAGVDGGVIRQLVAELAQGVEGRIEESFVLRKQQVAPNGATLAPAYAYAGRIYSTASLLSNEPTIPSNLRQGLPDGYWLKSAPSQEQTDRNRFTIVTEWTHADAYSAFLYGTPI